MGAVVHLYGMTHEPAYDAWSLADLELHMTESRFPGKIKDAVLEKWDTDRAWALGYSGALPPFLPASS